MSFNKVFPILDGRELAEKIAELAMKVEGSTGGDIPRKSFKEIPELGFVYLNAKEYEDAEWLLVQAHDGQIMSREKLREIVAAKESRSKGYRPCDAYWLLVIVDFMNPAQDQEIRVDDFEKIDSAVFEKVIVYRTAYGHAFEAK